MVNTLNTDMKYSAGDCGWKGDAAAAPA
jgi:hypothetical protein